jgi:hypothetical protein
MTDLAPTIDPKSDQLNADDLIAGSRTVRITKVSANPQSMEQPISIFFEGDNGKPYKPCKSMRRVLVHAWGRDGSAFVGRSLTLYRDPAVKFGGLEVGGIRISHMSDIAQPITMALTVTRASRKPFTVLPLVEAAALDLAREAASGGSDVFRAWWRNATKQEREAAQAIADELKTIRETADNEHSAPSPVDTADA